MGLAAAKADLLPKELGTRTSHACNHNPEILILVISNGSHRKDILKIFDRSMQEIARHQDVQVHVYVHN